jgi:hypothetical protein
MVGGMWNVRSRYQRWPDPPEEEASGSRRPRTGSRGTRTLSCLQRGQEEAREWESEEPPAREPEEDERVAADDDEDDEDVDLGSGGDDEGDKGEGEGEAAEGSSSSASVPSVWLRGPSRLPKRPILPPHRPMI